MQDLGLDRNTIVVYSTDHGDWLGDHGLILKGPMAYEGLLRVGLLVEGPGVPPGKIVDDPVSTLDLPATFCDYAGCALPEGAHSSTLRPLIERDDASRDFGYSEWQLRASRCGVDLASAHRAHRAPQADARAQLRRGRALRPRRRSARDGQPVWQSNPAEKQLTDMIRSRPADAAPRQPQVGMA